MRPDSYEVKLIKKQHEVGISIFGCDEHTVFSNRPVAYAPGHVSSVVDTNLTCEIGGEFRTAMNAAIFQVVWRKVISDARFRYHDWTVKVDPDSVFFPERLRRTLVERFEQVPPNGVYLNNCKFGLHGPLEVLSRVAVMRWAAGMDGCEAHFRREACEGKPCPWGEDLSMDQCMWKILKVERVNVSSLLNEAHCESADWEYCSAGDVAFHPFKTVEHYWRCLRNATTATKRLSTPTDAED
jgi:hypothetical protein